MSERDASSPSDSSDPTPTSEPEGAPAPVAPTPPEPTPTEPRRRSAARWILAGVGALALTGLVLLPTLAAHFGRAALERAIDEEIPGDVKVEALSLSWFGTQEIRGLEATAPDARAVIDVRIEQPFWVVLLSPGDMDRFLVSGSVRGVRYADGSLSLAELFPEGDDEEDPDDSRIDVVLSDVDCVLEDEATGWTLALPSASGTVVIDAAVAVDLAAEATLDGQACRVEVSVVHDARSLAPVQVMVGVESIPLAFVDAWAGAEGQLAELGGDVLDGSVRFAGSSERWALEVDLTAPRLHVEGALRVGEGRLQVGPILAQGVAPAQVTAALEPLQLRLGAEPRLELELEGDLPWTDGELGLLGPGTTSLTVRRVGELTPGEGEVVLDALQLTTSSPVDVLRDVALTLDLDGRATGGACTVRAAVTVAGLADREGDLLRLSDATASGELELDGLPLAMVEALATDPGALVPLFGATLQASLDCRSLGLTGGAVSLTGATSNGASLELHGSVDTDALRLRGERSKVSLPLSPELRRRLLCAAHPLLADLLEVQGGVTAATTELLVPMDGDLRRLRGGLTVTLGDPTQDSVLAASSPLLAVLEALRVVPGGRVRARLAPLTLAIADGVVEHEAFQVDVQNGGQLFGLVFSGQVDLVERRATILGKYPIAGLGNRFRELRHLPRGVDVGIEFAGVLDEDGELDEVSVTPRVDASLRDLIPDGVIPDGVPIPDEIPIPDGIPDLPRIPGFGGR
jgi:hypothetical protein